MLTTMLPATRLQARISESRRARQAFLSYLGTDLLMHDMGYLSQVGLVPSKSDPRRGRRW